ncbi:MAG: hypothetical protein WCX15_00395 [Bacilli bacterium]
MEFENNNSIVKLIFEENIIVYRTDKDEFYLKKGKEKPIFIYKGDYSTDVYYDEGKINFYHIDRDENNDFISKTDYSFSVKDEIYCLRRK